MQKNIQKLIYISYIFNHGIIIFNVLINIIVILLYSLYKKNY